MTEEAVELAVNSLVIMQFTLYLYFQTAYHESTQGQQSPVYTYNELLTLLLQTYMETFDLHFFFLLFPSRRSLFLGIIFIFITVLLITYATICLEAGLFTVTNKKVTDILLRCWHGYKLQSMVDVCHKTFRHFCRLASPFVHSCKYNTPTKLHVV